MNRSEPLKVWKSATFPTGKTTIGEAFGVGKTRSVGEMTLTCARTQVLISLRKQSSKSINGYRNF